MYNNNSYLETKSEKLLIESDCYTLPVSIENCAKYLGIKLESLDLDDNIAGFMLMKDKDTVHIGYNKKNPKTRIRFTIAHEIAHYILHAKETKLFVDKVVLYRDSNSSTGELLKEREANAFAAGLLMPYKLVVEEVEKHKNVSNDKLVTTLAKKLKVSEHAMTIRLTNLGFIDYDDFIS